MNNGVIAAIGQQIQQAQRIMLVSHVRPDGDAIGSLLGLGLALQLAGKDVQMVSSDGVPVNLRELDGCDQLIPKPSGEYDLSIVVDCSDIIRTGDALKVGEARYTLPDVNIDHHTTNLMFAKNNLVETEAVATAEILARVLPEWGLPIGPPVAAALLTGIITDTIGFRTANMTSRAMRIAANLMDAGADLPDLYRRVLVERSFEAARYWAMGLKSLQREDGLVWATLTFADRKAVEYPGSDDADLINLLASIKDVDVALVFVEQNHRHVKVSWRAKPGIDVSKVAVCFGGGGHMAASGAELEGSIDEVKDRVLEATRAVISSA